MITKDYENEMLELEARCHNTWADVVLLSVAGAAFLLSGLCPYLILVSVVCGLLFAFLL